MFATMLALTVPSVAAVAEGNPSEYDVKAAFLYNFAKFVEWPPNAFDATAGVIVLAVLGDDPFGPALDRIADQQLVQGRKIIVKRVARLEELGVCHVLFLRLAGEVSLVRFIKNASAAGRLLVGDSEQFAERGGAIGFFLEQRRVRFIVNLAAAERAGLKVSSKLLAVAKVIRN